MDLCSYNAKVSYACNHLHASTDFSKWGVVEYRVQINLNKASAIRFDLEMLNRTIFNWH